jgi:hypothetical protein
MIDGVVSPRFSEETAEKQHGNRLEKFLKILGTLADK